MGDFYQAARDYLYVIQHWPDQKQAYIGLIKSFIALKWTKEAQSWLDYFISLNQDISNSSQVSMAMFFNISLYSTKCGMFLYLTYILDSNTC